MPADLNTSFIIATQNSLSAAAQKSSFASRSQSATLTASAFAESERKMKDTRCKANAPTNRSRFISILSVLNSDIAYFKLQTLNLELSTLSFQL